MRTLDDFAFVKEAGFEKLYNSISETLSLYNEDLLKIYCGQFRNPLDCAIQAIYYLAKIKDAIVPKGLSGDNIGRLRQVLPEDLFVKTGGADLLTELNSTCRPYHHESGLPPREDWNKDAEKCYRLIVEICHWLVAFKENISKYLAENGPINWKEILEKKKEAFKALPENNSVAHTFQTGFEEVFLSQLDKTEDYRKSLEKDLEFYYNKMYEASSSFSQAFFRAFEGIEFPDEEAEDFSFVKKVLGVTPLIGATTEVMLYDSVIHPILFSHDWTPDELKKGPFTVIERIPFEDIFKGLLCVNSYAVNKVLGSLACSQSQIESLQSAFKNQNEESFFNSFKKLSCDVTAVHNLASFVPFIFKRDYGMMFKSKETYDWMLSSGTVLADKISSFAGSGLFDDSFFENSTEQERIDKGRNLFKQCNDMIIGGAFSSLNTFLHIDESKEWESLYPFEKEYVLNVLDNPDVISIIEKMQDIQSCQTSGVFSEREEHLEKLWQVIEDAPYDFLLSYTNTKLLSIDKSKLFINEAVNIGLLQWEDPAFCWKAACLLNGLKVSGESDYSAYLNRVADSATIIVKDKLVENNDELLLLKSIAVINVINNEQGSSTIEKKRDAIASYVDNLPFISPACSEAFDIVCSLLFPLMQAVRFIAKNYPLGVSKIIYGDDATNSPFIDLRVSLSEAFDYVKSMTVFGQKRLVADLGCPAYYEDEFLDAIKNGDYDTFKEICKSEKLTATTDLTVIVGYLINTIEKPLNFLNNIFKENAFAIGKFETHKNHLLASIGVKDDWFGKVFERICSYRYQIKGLIPSIQSDDEVELYAGLICFLIVLYSFFPACELDEAEVVNRILKDNPETGFLRLSQNIFYLLYREWPCNTELLFTDAEKAELEAIWDDKQSPETTAEKSIKVQSDNDFDLPEDFFTSKYPRDAKNTDKHFNLEYDIEKCGGTKFSLLVNTIASWGFISSSAKEKHLLAYILSGRSMPSGYQGEGLEWIDNGYGYELLYVIKYIIGNEKGKYEKARKLFHGPQWLGKGDFKDQADYADAAFRRALNAIYPEVCIIKGHVETVREPIRESGGFHIPDNPIKP